MELRLTKPIYCDVCGDVCMEAILSRYLTPRGTETYSLTEKVFDDLWLSLEKERYSTLMELYSNRKLEKLYNLNVEYVPFYCPKCKKAYCKKHWSFLPVWDEDGYYDQLNGWCPEGHKRMIFD